MYSSNPPLPSNISKTGVFMSSSVVLNTARVRVMAVSCVVTLTPVMLSPPETFVSMLRFAGG